MLICVLQAIWFRTIEFFAFYTKLPDIHSSRMCTILCNGHRGSLPGGMSAWVGGCLPRGVYLGECLPVGVSTQGVCVCLGGVYLGMSALGCLPGGCQPRGVCPGREGCLPRWGGLFFIE